MPELSVLIVDDEAIIAAGVQGILERSDFETTVAHSGEEALRLVENNRYQVVLLDYRLPGMDGITLFERIKQIQPGLEAVMATGNPGKDGFQRAQEAGIWQVVLKPVRSASLVASVRQAAERTLANESEAKKSDLE